MRIVDIRHAVAPISSPIRNASISFATMTVSVVAIVSDVDRDGAPLVGYGFCSNGRYAQPGILDDRLIPRLRAADPATLVDEGGENLDPLRVWAAFMRDEKPGGHGDRAVAAGALDMAVWDLTAKLEGRPLWRVLADRFNHGRADERVMVYPGGGYYHPDDSLRRLTEEIEDYLADGYTLVKVKIGGADLAADVKRIETVLDLVDGGGNLAVDANGRFDSATARAYARAMAPYGLLWFEEPGDPLDFLLHADLAEQYAPGLATGENLFSHQDVRNLLRYAGLRPDRDWIQVDPALAYGLSEYLRVIDVVEKAGWSRRRLLPHGGHQLALNAAAGLQLGGAESYPLVFQPFGGFAEDIPIAQGRTTLPDAPGLGIELRPALIETLKRLTST